MTRRQIAALHVHGDFAVRPGVTLAQFPDGSSLALFDSFKPACGYSSYWFALKTGEPGTWWHIDVRELMPARTFDYRSMPIDAGTKMPAMRELLQASFGSAQEVLAAAKPGTYFVADTGNNELLARSALR